jgi:oligopeptide transport system substrate-binding protein
MLFKYLLVLMVGYFMLLISGCEEAPSSSPKSSKLLPDDELRIPFNGVVRNIDPGLTMHEANQIELVEQLFLGLTTLKRGTYEAVPRLAKKWEKNQEGTVYTFWLRQDAKWSNGKPVTAHDVVWTIQRNFRIYLRKYGYLNSAFGMLENAQLNQAKLEQDQNADISSLGVRAIDDYTVEFTLKYPLSFFPALVSYASYRPLPSQFIEKHGDNWTEQKPTEIPSNGPYQLSAWEVDKVSLIKNPNYYDADQVKISKVHYYVVPKSSTGLAMYEKDQLDIMGGASYLRLPDTQLPRIKSDIILSKDLRGGSKACTEWYGFNTQREPTNDLQVRKAIAAAIDKQFLIDVVLKSNHIPANTFTLASLLDLPPEQAKRCPKETSPFGVPFCPAQAKNDCELATAHEQKTICSQLVLLHNISETHHAMAKGIQALLKHYLKIEIEVKALPYYSYSEAIGKPTKDTPHLFREGWCGTYPEAYLWLELFHPQDGNYNWLLKGNEYEKEFSAIVNEVLQVSDKIEREKLYRRAEEILTNKAVVMIPLFFYNSPVLVKPWVKNWYHMSYGGQHIHDWSLEKQKPE